MSKNHHINGGERGPDRRNFLKLAAGVTVLAGAGGIVALLRPFALKLLKPEKKETEAFKKALSQIEKAISDFYRDQKIITLEEALKTTDDLSVKLIDIFKSHGIEMPSGETPQRRIMNFFQEHGYVFATSPLALDGDSYVVNAPLYRIGNSRKFHLAELKCNPLQESHTVITIHDVEKTLAPDFRESAFFSGPPMVFDGMTISDPSTGDSTVLLFPDKIKKIAREDGLDHADYFRTVEINEVAQVYFSETVPNQALGLTLAEFGIDTRGHHWTLLHVQEAFSDFASLKFGKTFKHELTRILRGVNDSYDFSKTIALAAVNLGLEKSGISERMTPDNAKEVIQKLEGKQYEFVKRIVIDSYEENIKVILLKVMKKAHR